MKRLRIIGVGVALLFAFSILVVSLTSVTPVHSAFSAGKGSSADKEFYISGEILPDHIGYPILMAIDRLRLETSTPLERVYLQTEYANRRLAYTQALVEKDKLPLALSTYTKAHKYLLRSGQEAMEEDMPVQVKHYVKESIRFHQEKGSDLMESFEDQEKPIFEQINKESMALLEQLDAAS